MTLLRLALATAVVLAPGAAIARALGVRTVSATLAWALAAIFAALGVVNDELTAEDTVALVGGVFAGSAAWWLLLAAIAAPIRGRLDPNHLEWIGRVAGVLLLASGLYVLASIAWPHLI
jgi:hypothetical protein